MSEGFLGEGDSAGFLVWLDPGEVGLGCGPVMNKPPEI